MWLIRAECPNSDCKSEPAMLATCFSVLASVADLGVERGIEWMLTVFISHLCSSTSRTNITSS